ncbi:hypothetical protein S7711_03931 [Stachybotrys chartarum IBT 7711]|uniref:Autophagy-related protein 13 n=1 Tax=Stachybotrys chartarum (strain CBS 109288 / IBT 7711) TaxID=1280523 RepID=A0A084AQU9_STACB|nr:hypothetical protein S7711_03931 [Stachybotrys chartarum IBT 7711]KFA54782.1 hypothetical protein S40293_00735 [Stachybotrys chartarum IBT 40293]KFA76410.1 hypothetical protein S40288_04791 [Stachybotrys chartarum IBT 40288]
MHQQTRGPPRVASPASAPQTNPSRTNNPREGALASRQRAGSAVSGKDVLGSPTTETSPSLSPPVESVKKLDQIVQNFYTKAAAIILDSRIKVKPLRNSNGSRKINKWYQIETDEIEDFREELKTWKNCGSLDNHPPPMVIEVYLDMSALKDSQSLVILDEEGKRWDVLDQLNGSASSDEGSPTESSKKNTEVLLERWRIDLTPTGSAPNEDFGPVLPTVYKKAIVFFRSLFIATRLLPSWKLASQRLPKTSHPALVPRCRISSAESRRDGPDLLRHPIDGRRDPVTEYMFGDLDVPVGRLSTSVTYRNDCSFRIDDSEALLSSRFMGVDENFFKPSLPQRNDRARETSVEIGSLRDDRARPNPSDLHQTYGSLSTFHGDGPLGTSPMSALRAVKPPGSDTSSPPSSVPAQPEIDPPNSLPIVGRSSISRPPLRGGDAAGRRPSISFQPFKAGSLSGSPIPRQLDTESPASPHSLSRPGGIPSLQQPRNRTSLTAGMPASLRGGPAPINDQAVPSSPRPASTSRYSSSFTHRRGRLSFGGASRAGDDEQGSSGRQSLASSVAQPGSGLLAEAEAASSGSFGPDESDNAIEDFLKALDSKKTLKSFETHKRGESATNRTVAQLSKFHMMKESNNALTDSMTSSVQMQRSSSSSSRQLTSVPGMVAPASLSASSSPGKPLSPHTPHTPAIPSRLSENSSIDYPAVQGGRVTARQSAQGAAAPGPSRESTIRQEGTTAIDIPLSPRLGSYQQRRSSSVAQQSRAIGEDEDNDLAFAAHRSISLGADDDREPPTMSILLGRQLGLEEEESTQRQGSSSSLQPAADLPSAEEGQSLIQGSADDNPLAGLMPSSQASSPFGRRRYMGMAAAVRRDPTPQSSRGSFTGSLGRPVRADDESINEEPLVFDLSEMDAQGRRSIEEGRGGGHGSGGDRGATDFRGTTRRGW